MFRAGVAVLLAILAGAQTSWATCPDFTEAVNYPAGPLPYSVAVGDFNRDGKPDLAVAEPGAGVSVLLGNGGGTFQSAISYAAGNGSHSVAVGDFDGDGKQDLAVANSGSGNVSILLGNGNGTFGVATQSRVGTGPESVAVGDFNRDGILDLATANKLSDNVSILLGTGGGAFTSAVQYDVDRSPVAVAIADFDNDGELDLAVATSARSNVSVLLGNGLGAFGAAMNYDAGNTPQSVASGDFNGDGKTDLAVAKTGNARVSILIGDGSGAFAAPVEYQAGGTQRSVAVGDINGDGKSDVVTGGENVALLIGDGTGAFAAPLNYNPRGLNSVAVADLDGDGRSDLAVAQSAGNVSILLNSSICWQDCGTFGGVIGSAQGLDVTSMAIGDFNRDGKPDFAVADHGAPGGLGVWIAIQNQNGTFQAPVKYSSTANPFDPLAIAIGDFNRDGKPDVVTANDSTSNVTILVGRGDGTFDAPVHYPVGASASSVAVADLNRDGKLDLAVIASTFVRILLGRGDGTFEAASRVWAGITGYVAGDLVVPTSANGFRYRSTVGGTSGATEPVWPTTVGTTVVDGTVTWTSDGPDGVYAAGTSPYFVAIEDFDGNGKPDLAVANSNTSTATNVSILLGNGDGTFNAPAHYNVVAGGARAYSLATGDFNTDGKPDLAVGNSSQQKIVSVLTGNGNGTFTVGPTYTLWPIASSALLMSIAIGDVNVDGKADLAVASFSINSSERGLLILLGTGNATFANPVAPLPLNFGNWQVVLHDVNGDGKPDLGAVDRGSLAVIFANTCPSPDLTVAKTHQGTFTQGDNGKTFTLTVNNAGTLSTNGAVAVTDTLPAGLTATAIGGTGWACDLATLTCTRSDGIFANSGAEVITLTVNVASNAPPNVTNRATVSGGGEINTSNNTADDPITITQIPDLTVTKTHIGTFSQGQTGATYTIIVNNIGGAPTSGTVTMNDTLPGGLTATALAGTGWTCTLGTTTCTRSDALDAASSYPAITLTVNVANLAPASVTNTVNVSGGGETNTSDNTANDPTTVIQFADLTVIKTHTGNFTQGQTGAIYTIEVTNSGTGPTSGLVTMTDTLPSGMIGAAITGAGWTCELSTVSCTRSDVFPASTSYPPITLAVDVNSNAPRSVTNTANVSGGGEIITNNNSAGDLTTINDSVGLIAPTNVVADVLPNLQVRVTWNGVTGNFGYGVFRSSNNMGYAPIETLATTNFTDTTAAATTAYLYRVSALDGSNNAGPPSKPDLATTILFTDDPVVAGTVIKAVHPSELRTAVDAVRVAAGRLPAFTGSLAPGVVIAAVHLTELRLKLDEARADLGLPAIQYVDPALAPGDTVKAAHIQQLRAGVK